MPVVDPPRELLQKYRILWRKDLVVWDTQARIIQERDAFFVRQALVSACSEGTDHDRLQWVEEGRFGDLGVSAAYVALGVGVFAGAGGELGCGAEWNVSSFLPCIARGQLKGAFYLSETSSTGAADVPRMGSTNAITAEKRILIEYGRLFL